MTSSFLSGISIGTALIVCALSFTGCAESTLDEVGMSPDTRDVVLDHVIAAKVLRDVHGQAQYIRPDTSKWYWAFDLSGIADGSVRTKLEHMVRSAVPPRAQDTLTAVARRSVFIALPEILGDSALVYVEYKQSWEVDCSWLHSSSSHAYIFRRSRGIWRFDRDNEHVIADPGVAPPAGPERVCYPRGRIGWE